MDGGEIIVYGPHLDEIARHGRRPRGHAEPVVDPMHHPGRKKGRDIDVLVQRLGALGDAAAAFAAGVSQRQRYRGTHLAEVLALQERYDRGDLVAAMQRAVRYRAFDARVVARILQTTATPRILPDTVEQASRQRLRDDLADIAVPPRELEVYERLLAPGSDTER